MFSNELFEVPEYPSVSGSSVDMNNLMLKSSLLCVYMKVGAENRLYSFKEVLGLFKTYVFTNKHLIDPEDPSRILCKDDVLGKALGVESFSVHEAKMLLMRCVFPVPLPENYSKSQSSEDTCNPSTSTDTTSSSQETSNCSPCDLNCSCPIIYTLPEILDYNSDPETVYSYQGYETARCRDDYDTDNSGDLLMDEPMSNQDEHEPVTDIDEYEPVTDIDEYVSVNDTDSDAFSFASEILVLQDTDDFNEDFFADESDYKLDSGHSSSEDEPDKWTCLTCSIQNRPYMRYCEKCWEERKVWFPERPAQRKRRKTRPKKDRRSGELKKADTIIGSNFDLAGYDLKRHSSTQSSTASISGSSQDSGVACSLELDYEPSSTKTRPRESDSDEAPTKYNKMLGPNDLNAVAVKFRKFASTSKGRKWVGSNRADDLRERILPMESDSETEKFSRKFSKFASSFSGRRWLQSSSGAAELFSNLESVSSDSDLEISDEKCSICWCKAANASIVHGNISHLGYCYSCAKRLFLTKSRCPACRRKIDRITKNCFV